MTPSYRQQLVGNKILVNLHRLRLIVNVLKRAVLKDESIKLRMRSVRFCDDGMIMGNLSPLRRSITGDGVLVVYSFEV